MLDQNVFTKVYLDADENGPYVAADELADLVAPLVEEARNENGGTAVEDDAARGGFAVDCRFGARRRRGGVGVGAARQDEILPPRSQRVPYAAQCGWHGSDSTGRNRLRP